jgi:hypothetical protein
LDEIYLRKQGEIWKDILLETMVLRGPFSDAAAIAGKERLQHLREGKTR